jgi:alpha-1,3-mannosyltransferase
MLTGSYPAGHVWIYTALYKITSKGRDIFSAQVVFMLLYLATLAVTLSLYRTAKVLSFLVEVGEFS